MIKIYEYRSINDLTKIYSPALFFLVIALVLSVGNIKVHAEDSTSYPWIRPDSWLSQVIKSPVGGASSGHIGVDAQLKQGDSSYNPCHNLSDPFVDSCESRGGYYKVMRYGSNGNDFPYGIFIDNSNQGIDHFFAKRVKTVYLEIYPYSVPVNAPLSGYRLDPGACNCSVVGGYEVIIDDWKGGYSENIGALPVVSLSDSNAGKMNGFAKRNGVSVGDGEVNVDWFGQDAIANLSGSGFKTFSFASWPSNSDGYYTSGPVVKGDYHIFITDNGPSKAGPVRKVECVGISVKGLSDRLDMELTQSHFGLDGPNRQCYDR